jgi:RNA 3'-terminal phosphate cyclase (ATP)
LKFLEIDGSFGEGGGQSIRIATSFAVILNKPIHVMRVRAGRRIPGLRPQHATTLRILTEICGGTLEGGGIGSTEFTFIPGKMESRSIAVDMGTAASMTLALQAIVPAIALSGNSLDLELVGGTDVPWSPTCDYFSAVFSESLRKLGVLFTLDVMRRGYYPSGGGKVRVHIEPCRKVEAVTLDSRRSNPPISIVSRAGMLPERVAEQQMSSAVSQLDRYGLHPKVKSVRMEDSLSPGSSILVSAVGDDCFIGSDSIGARGKPAFKVGSEAAAWFARSYNSPACVDPHLADMLSPLLFLADGPSALLTPQVTGHLRTSLHVAKQFVPAQYTTEEHDGVCTILINPPQTGVAAK